MKTALLPSLSAARRIVAADSLPDVIIVEFSDGREAIYPADVLYALDVENETSVAEQVKKMLA